LLHCAAFLLDIAVIVGPKELILDARAYIVALDRDWRLVQRNHVNPLFRSKRLAKIGRAKWGKFKWDAAVRSLLFSKQFRP
jgi:hypothetical protein